MHSVTSPSYEQMPQKHRGLVQVTLLCLQRTSAALAGTLTMNESSPSAGEMQGLLPVQSCLQDQAVRAGLT